MTHRTIEVGDIVSILIGDKSYQYPIRAITQQAILVGDYQIIYVKGVWQVKDLKYQHAVTFYPKEIQPREGLTNIDDTDLLIMTQLPIMDLIRLCKTSVKYDTLCKKDNLWNMRVINEYGEVLYKPTALTFYQYYIAKKLTPADAARTGDKQMLQWMNLMGKKLTVLDLETALEYNQHAFFMSFIRPFIMQRDPHIQKVFLKAAEKGDVRVLEYILNEYKGFGRLLRYDEAAEAAATKGHLTILQIMHEKGVLFSPTMSGEILLAIAMKNGHEYIVQWLKGNNIEIKSDFLKYAIKVGDLNLIKMYKLLYYDGTYLYFFLKKGTKDYEEGFGIACNPETLQWLQSKGAVLSTITANEAAGQESTVTLQWLYDQRIMPDAKAYYYAVAHRRIDSLNWLHSHNIVPNFTAQEYNPLPPSRGNNEILDWFVQHFGNDSVSFQFASLIFDAVKRGDITTIKWFGEHGYPIPVTDDYIPMLALEGGYLEILQYINENNKITFHEPILSDTRGDPYDPTIICATKGYLDILQWLESIGYSPSLETGVVAARNGFVEIVEWVYRHGISMSRADIVSQLPTYGPDPLKGVNFPTIIEWLVSRKIEY